ncbi:hypothetical protein ACU6U9_14080 [Pseudomonas sp. HK3]
MNLFDFKNDESLNKLRELIGTEQLGTFELFDPKRHLSWQDRQLLAKQWVDVEGNILRSGDDNILYFKNSPVVVKVDDVFHFALCDDIKKRIGQGQLPNINATTCNDLMANATNCSYCLHAVSYEGFDAYRHRHQQYNEKILKSFNLNQFLVSKSAVFKA